MKCCFKDRKRDVSILFNQSKIQSNGIIVNKKLTVIKKDNYYCLKAYNYEN